MYSLCNFCGGGRWRHAGFDGLYKAIESVDVLLQHCVVIWDKLPGIEALVDVILMRDFWRSSNSSLANLAQPKLQRSFQRIPNFLFKDYVCVVDSRTDYAQVCFLVISIATCKLVVYKNI